MKSVQSFAICQLENQEGQWCNSVQIQKPENQGADSGKPRKAQEQGVLIWEQEKMGVSAQTETVHLYFLHQ